FYKFFLLIVSILAFLSTYQFFIKYEYKIKVINLSFQFLLKCYLFFKINRVLCKLQLFIILKCELL
ncbi:hypothetical protein DWA08_03670, partial [Acinetobacter baumannii]